MPKPLPRIASVRTLTTLALAGKDHRGWYPDARKQVIAAAAVLGTTPERFADLLALFSPRVSVLRSVRFAVLWQREGLFAHDTIRSVRAGVDHYEQTGEIRGPKTSAFASALKGDDDAVVLDTWMARAFGVRSTDFGNRPRVFRECERRIRQTANDLHWNPAETQAAIWAGVVRENRVTVPTLLIAPELEPTDYSDNPFA